MTIRKEFEEETGLSYQWPSGDIRIEYVRWLEGKAAHLKSNDIKIRALKKELQFYKQKFNT